jgi:hypothetical protein
MVAIYPKKVKEWLESLRTVVCCIFPTRQAEGGEAEQITQQRGTPGLEKPNP